MLFLFCFLISLALTNDYSTLDELRFEDEDKIIIDMLKDITGKEKIIGNIYD